MKTTPDYGHLTVGVKSRSDPVRTNINVSTRGYFKIN